VKSDAPLILIVGTLTAITAVLSLKRKKNPMSKRAPLLSFTRKFNMLYATVLLLVAATFCWHHLPAFICAIIVWELCLGLFNSNQVTGLQWLLFGDSKDKA
jgi:hypothetical protein